MFARNLGLWHSTAITAQQLMCYELDVDVLPSIVPDQHL